MSLVDYASSSDDDVSVVEDEQEENQPLQLTLSPIERLRPPSPINARLNRPHMSSANQPPKSMVPSTAPTIEKLPDASFLLNSPTVPMMGGYGNVSRATAESTSRKRDSNGQSSSLPRSKVPRGTLRCERNVPQTVGHSLVPPQLTGRSNVVTEDISKLFVKRSGTDPQTRGSPN